MTALRKVLTPLPVLTPYLVETLVFLYFITEALNIFISSNAGYFLSNFKYIFQGRYEDGGLTPASTNYVVPWRVSSSSLLFTIGKISVSMRWTPILSEEISFSRSYISLYLVRIASSGKCSLWAFVFEPGSWLKILNWIQTSPGGVEKARNYSCYLRTRWPSYINYESTLQVPTDVLEKSIRRF